MNKEQELSNLLANTLHSISDLRYFIENDKELFNKLVSKDGINKDQWQALVNMLVKPIGD